MSSRVCQGNGSCWSIAASASEASRLGITSLCLVVVVCTNNHLPPDGLYQRATKVNLESFSSYGEVMHCRKGNMDETKINRSRG